MKKNLLLLIFLCSTLLLSAQIEVDGIAYYFNGSEATVTYKWLGYEGDIVIPGTVEYNGATFNVTAIGGDAFYNSDDLKSITIPESVTIIGAGAFSGCSSLSSITIPEGVTTIEYNAFEGCSSLTSITIPESVTTIENGVFGACSSLSSITISEGVKTIGQKAFFSCSSLTSITIPESVTTIGVYAFNFCTSLSEINVDTNNANYSSAGGVLYNKDKTTLITCPAGSTEVAIENSVTTIEDYAFFNCTSLSSITIPEGVTTIGDGAFEYCSSLTSITIPKGVTTIGDYAFSQCSSLTSITIPESITTIGDSVFRNCTSLSSITISESVTTIGDGVFWNCTSLSSITIPESVTTIGYSVFRNCTSLSSITIPESVTTIGDYTFYGCSSITEFYSYNPSPISINERVFHGSNQSNCILYVPRESASAYSTADYWKDFAEIREMPTVGIEDVFDTNGSSNVTIDVYTRNNLILIDGTQAGEAVALYSINGTLLQNLVSTGDQITMQATEGNIYIVKTTRKAVKVVL